MKRANEVADKGDWFDLVLAGADAALKPIQDRARRRLARVRDKLPRLTKKQAELIVEMMVDAYKAGERDGQMEEYQRDCERAQNEYQETVSRSLRGVMARRKKSKRWAIIEAFKAAAAERKDVSIEQLAKEHGVSRSTAYRALAMTAPKAAK